MVNIKIKPDDVIPIRIAYINGISLGALSEKYGVSKQAIWDVIIRKNYKNIF